MNTLSPSLADFTANNKQGKTQLVWAKIPGDLETPVAAYLKLCDTEKYSFLLESIEGGAVLGRYSVIGFDPDLVWNYDGDNNNIASLKTLLKTCHIDIQPENLPPMAVSGLFGYMGYDTVRAVEDIPDTNPDTLNIPDSILIRPQTLVIFDNVYNEIFIVTPVYDTDTDAETLYNDASNRINNVIKTLHGAIPPNALNTTTTLKTPLDVRSNTTRDEFHDMVATAKTYILDGDIFQGVLSQRFDVDFDLPASALYRALRTLNPSPFMFLVNFEGFALVGSSPEILVRVRDETVTIRPIAGTRKRGTNTLEDNALAEDLLNDPKECAEHLMLLDLGRNDIGRVSQFGTVDVTEQFTIELYSHVMHIVSNVEGKLRDDLDIIDAMYAGFPAGTVSGAPKVRAMEIIDELEKHRRSYYGGSVGYFSGNGEMDTCIALRTALVKDGKMYIQAGAGIVADSDPESEYIECINKSKALIDAAQQAIDRAG